MPKGGLRRRRFEVSPKVSIKNLISMAKTKTVQEIRLLFVPNTGPPLLFRLVGGTEGYARSHRAWLANLPTRRPRKRRRLLSKLGKQEGTRRIRRTQSDLSERNDVGSASLNHSGMKCLDRRTRVVKKDLAPFVQPISPIVALCGYPRGYHNRI